MRKRYYSKVIIMLVLGFSLVWSSTVFAADNEQVTAKQVFRFDEQELEQGWALARSQKVYTDKPLSNGVVRGKTDPNTYPTRRGVILVTADKYKDLIPLGHAAIVWTSTTVVESLTGGVVTGRNDWQTTRDTCYGVTTHGTTSAQDSQAASWCYNQIGKPYNFNYPDKWTRSRFYCSQLVYAAYKDLFNIDLDTLAYLSAVHPMELVNTSKTYTIYTK